MMEKLNPGLSIHHTCCSHLLETPVSASTMHLYHLFSQPSEASDFDCELERSLWAMSLINYWITHPFKIANCNGFHFNAYPLGLKPNSTLHVFMMLYDLHSSMYIHYYDDINMHANVDVQLLYMLFGLMDYLQPDLQYKHDCCNSGHNRFP